MHNRHSIRWQWQETVELLGILARQFDAPGMLAHPLRQIEQPTVVSHRSCVRQALATKRGKRKCHDASAYTYKASDPSRSSCCRSPVSAHSLETELQ